MKKQFRVEITTKGSYEVEVAPIDTNEYDINDITFDDFMELMDNSEYICSGALEDGWSGTFEMKVFDESDNVIYESDDFDEFPFIFEFDEDEDEDFELNVDFKKVKEECEKRWKEDDTITDPGIYAVCRHDMKWVTFRFSVEDEDFDPKKLLFVANKNLECLVCEYMTEPTHVFYDDKFVDVDDYDCSDEYGCGYYIMEKNKYGCWNEEALREVHPLD